MKYFRILPLLLLFCVVTTSCKPPIDFPFSLSQGQKLHIFTNQSDLDNSGIPAESKTFIINNDKSIADEYVGFGQGVQSIEKIHFDLTYEYHADSYENPVILKFIITGTNGDMLWQGKQSIEPKTTKTKLEESFDFPIGREYDGMDVTISAIPVSSGDYGFFIYNLEGIITVK
jgi:hypothetical protein